MKSIRIAAYVAIAVHFVRATYRKLSAPLRRPPLAPRLKVPRLNTPVDIAIPNEKGTKSVVVVTCRKFAAKFVLGALYDARIPYTQTVIRPCDDNFVLGTLPEINVFIHFRNVHGLENGTTPGFAARPGLAETLVKAARLSKQ